MRQMFRAVAAMVIGCAAVVPLVGEPASAAVPSAPLIGVTPANGSVRIGWKAPATGGRAITDYHVQYKRASSTKWVTFNDGVRSTPSATVTRLSNKTAYHFRVRAKNSQGFGAFSRIAGSTPGLPAAPPRPTASLSGSSLRLAWRAPANGGFAIRDYRVECSRNSGTTWTSVADGVRATTGATIAGLAKGATWMCRILAVNALGSGRPSAASAPVRIPSSPPVGLPLAMGGSLTSINHDTRNGADVTITMTVSNARFVLEDRPQGRYRLSAGTATIEVSGTTMNGVCTVAHTTTTSLTSPALSFNTMTMLDNRLSGFPKPPGTVGPVYYNVRLFGYPDVFTVPYIDPSIPACQYGFGVEFMVSYVGESTPFTTFPLDVGVRHAPSYALKGSLTHQRGVGDQQTYTWNLAPVA